MINGDDLTLNRLVFVDIETTGLEVNKGDLVLEVGLAVTDLEFNTLGTWSSLVYNDGWRPRLARNEFTWQMHTKSGLISDLDKLDIGPHRLGDLDPAVVALMGYKWLTEEMRLPDCALPSCGNSVHFDRDFLKGRMIVLNSFFTHRNIDVSTLKELCRRYHPELYKTISDEFNKDKAKHRVIPDIESSIAELKIYVDNFLFVPGNELEAKIDSSQLILPGLETLGR